MSTCIQVDMHKRQRTFCMPDAPNLKEEAMIFGNIRDYESFAWLPEPLKIAVNHLRNTDFAALEPQNYELQGRDIYVQVFDMNTKPVAETQPEVHVQYLDVHFSVEGKEKIGFAGETGDNEVAKDLLAERDLMFNTETRNESWVEMTPGSFAVFLPNDVHRPGCALESPAAIRKVVMKVRVSLLQGERP